MDHRVLKVQLVTVTKRLLPNSAQASSWQRTSLETELATLRDVFAHVAVLGLATNALRGKPIHASRVVDEHVDVGSFRVLGHRPFPYQVDGDFLGDATSLTLKHEPEVLRLVVP